MILTKETFLVVVVLIYFAYWSYKSWGQQFRCKGLDSEFYRRFVTKHVSCEDKCRNIFENFFNVSFNKCRPDFLLNPITKKRLELDGYNPSIPTSYGMGLAFEYNGPQHYFFTPKYHKCVEDFEDQLSRDRLKQKLCKDNGILLLTIPYTVTNFEDYILKKIYENDLFYYLK
jgi:hypothetical protein